MIWPNKPKEAVANDDDVDSIRRYLVYVALTDNEANFSRIHLGKPFLDLLDPRVSGEGRERGKTEGRGK